MDILLSIIALILLTPLFTVVAILIKIDSKGPIFFRQERYGKDKKVFTIYKFRTMYIDTPSQVATRDLDNAKEHISKIGRFLRNTSIDELPQIFNVLAGHMSLIGPRPVILAEYEQVEEREKWGANSIRPGMSGLAQINGRDFLDVKTKAMYDGADMRLEESFREICPWQDEYDPDCPTELLVDGDEVDEYEFDHAVIQKWLPWVTIG